MRDGVALRQLVELHDQPLELDLDDADLDEPCFGESSGTRSTICEFGSTKGLAADWQQAHSAPILIKDFLNPNIYKALSPSSHTPPPPPLAYNRACADAGPREHGVQPSDAAVGGQQHRPPAVRAEGPLGPVCSDQIAEARKRRREGTEEEDGPRVDLAVTLAHRRTVGAAHGPTDTRVRSGTLETARCVSLT